MELTKSIDLLFIYQACLLCYEKIWGKNLKHRQYKCRNWGEWPEFYCFKPWKLSSTGRCFISRQSRKLSVIYFTQKDLESSSTSIPIRNISKQLNDCLTTILAHLTFKSYVCVRDGVGELLVCHGWYFTTKISCNTHG